MNRREFSLSLLFAVPSLASLISQVQAQSQLRVNGERLNSRLMELARFGKTPEGGTHRLAYTELICKRASMRLN